MMTILNLFGRSPFLPLNSHMEKVASCVQKVEKLLNELLKADYTAIETLAARIHELEHQADLTKNDIRNHLPKSLFLPVDRQQLLEILGIQDSIADRCEDIAVIVTLKQLALPPVLLADFQAFVAKNIECFNSAHKIIKELHHLLESSFGGIEAERVRSMVEAVAYQEHEADIIQRRLLKGLIAQEQNISFTTFYLWTRVFEAIAAISNQSEKLANRMRMTLDLK